MELKEELIKLKEKIKGTFTSDPNKQLETMAQDEEPLGYGKLATAINFLIESKNALEEENRSLKEQIAAPRMEAISDQSENSQTVVLDDKVDEFIDWFTENMVKGRYSDRSEYSMPIEMRNFIEKMAVWYELRYPDYEVNRIMHCSGEEPTEVSEEMFNKNQYINQQLDQNSEVSILDWLSWLDWDEFYNAKAFIHSLPSDEKYYFMKPKYQDIVYWNSPSSAHLHLTRNGFVEMAEYMNLVLPNISNEELEGQHIKEVVKMLKAKGVQLPEGNEFEQAIKDYDNQVYQKDEMLNCVMYRIIERGGNRFGPRRAFLFAQEFGRNIDIPMAYGVDRLDPGLRSFINEYLKAGGSEDLVCHVGYGSRSSKYEQLPTITIKELITPQNNNDDTSYTEEDETPQILFNALFSQINPSELPEEQKEIKEEEIKKLTFQRKESK